MLKLRGCKENLNVLTEIRFMKAQHAKTWRGMPESYWLHRLAGICSDVGLTAIYHGWKCSTVDFFLVQIASIAWNWLEYRQENREPEQRRLRRFRRKGRY